jgi:hypothetical protein
MRQTTLVFALLLLALGCKEAIPGKSVNRLSLTVHPASPDSADPFDKVAFMRIAVDGEGIESVDKFVQYTGGVTTAPVLDTIPFGKNLRIVVEGWSEIAGQLGELRSRGRSAPFDMTENSEPVQLTVILSRANKFSHTTAIGPSGTFSTSLSQGRVGQSATKLRDGRVLILGGASLKTGISQFKSSDDLQEIFASAEIYDPGTGKFTSLSGPNASMTHPRAYHTATLIETGASNALDGKVLITGGISEISGIRQTLEVVQIFDPLTLSFEPVTDQVMAVSRAGHTANLLDGKGHVVLAGGFRVETSGKMSTVNTLEVYKVGEGKVWDTGLNAGRYFHTATRAPLGAEGKDAIVLVGGEDSGQVLESIEIFDYLQEDPVVELGKDMLFGGARTQHGANYVASQKYIHITGGYTNKEYNAVENVIDSYDTVNKKIRVPNVGNGESPFTMMIPRAGHQAVGMANNVILLFGGHTGTEITSSAEVIYEYYDTEANVIRIERGGVGAMVTPRNGHSGVLLDNGTVLTMGGASAPGTLVTDGEFFNPL